MGRSLHRKAVLIILFIAVFGHGRGQDRWDAYVARYEAGLGSVILNMHVQDEDRSSFPYLLVTGVDCKECTGDGFPLRREYKRLYRLSDEVNRHVLQTLTMAQPELRSTEQGSTTDIERNRAILVGNFTHLCQRLDYIYLADTTGIRSSLKEVYGKFGRGYAYHIQFQRDPEWDAYKNFLYPNESVRIFMMNNRAITRMRDAGDVLSRPRFVEHLIYFDTIEDRELFIRYIGRMKYDIKEERDMRRDNLRYQVRLARFGTVSLEEMNDQTTYLSTKARDFNGTYDGWDTKLIGTKQQFRLLHNSIAEPTNTAK
ncbi:DUF695 domain-containing protein [Chryseolinea sp. T2]|uniref:DUF695 domain-containing protein n=1 Tax=Chryseolinea sp. T2 TaxID=3129255 RepID=UPI003076C81E